MKASYLTGLCCATALACSINVSAQTSTPQGTLGSPAQQGTAGSASSDTSSTSTSSDDRVVTIVGCVQSESAAAGTSGAGSGNEFVLTNATMGTADRASAPTTPPAVGTSGSESEIAAPPDADANEAEPPSSRTASSGVTSRAVGTSGEMANVSGGLTYTLTGSREGDMARLVGKRVEITGTLEQDRSGASVGMTSATPDAGGRDGSTDSASGNAGRSAADAAGSGSVGAGASASLPKVDITRYREIGGSCAGSAR